MHNETQFKRKSEYNVRKGNRRTKLNVNDTSAYINKGLLVVTDMPTPDLN